MLSLPHRQRLPEIMDQPDLRPARHVGALRGLARVNFWSGSAGILWRPLSALARRLGRPIRVLDAASGGGDVPLRLWRRRLPGRSGHPHRRLRPQPRGGGARPRPCRGRRRRHAILRRGRAARAGADGLRRGHVFALPAPPRRGGGGRLPALGGGDGGAPGAGQRPGAERPRPGAGPRRRAPSHHFRRSTRGRPALRRERLHDDRGPRPGGTGRAARGRRPVAVAVPVSC